MNNALFLSLLIIMFCPTSIFAQKSDRSGNKMAFYECSGPMDIDSIGHNKSSGELYFHFNQEEKPKNLKSKGFIWYEDNPEYFFNAYLVNQSDSTIEIDRQDGSLIMIQEALNELGEWVPIEYWVHSGCGNSYFNPLKLESGKCVYVPIRIYSGEFNTQFRLKLKLRDKIFYSGTFEGSIAKSQFRRETNLVNGILYEGPAYYLDDN